MAMLSFNLPDELIESMNKIGNNIDVIAPKMLENGMIPVKKAIKKNAQQHFATGEMEKSIKTSKPKKTKKGDTWNKNTFFDGYDIRGKNKKSKTANALKAMALEYGRSNQDAKPFIRPALEESKNEAINNMQETFTEEVNKL